MKCFVNILGSVLLSVRDPEMNGPNEKSKYIIQYMYTMRKKITMNTFKVLSRFITLPLYSNFHSDVRNVADG